VSTPANTVPLFPSARVDPRAGDVRKHLRGMCFHASIERHLTPGCHRREATTNKPQP
jgi:hypothetical protein